MFYNGVKIQLKYKKFAMEKFVFNLQTPLPCQF